MQLRFYEDPDSGQPHIYNHGVTEAEVRQVLARPGEDRPVSMTPAWRSAKRRPVVICE